MVPATTTYSISSNSFRQNTRDIKRGSDWNQCSLSEESLKPIIGINVSGMIGTNDWNQSFHSLSLIGSKNGERC
ncbi:MAG: hypothetical protein DRJ40_07300 [Thermoprotei archaeon]|nr:MAG: hypothetical protein DRJ40_07300 [Thermoprotei archaeon]